MLAGPFAFTPPHVLLIDIINELEFGGADFLPALEEAKRRRRLLRPVLHRVLQYAAAEPVAYQFRFSYALLDCAAYLLAEAQDPEFLRLAAPLIDGDRPEPNLLGYGSDDMARLTAAAAGNRVGDIASAICAETEPPEEFCCSALSALVLCAYWTPPLLSKVTLTLRSLLSAELLPLVPRGAMGTLVECCCRLDPDDFSLAFQLAIDRGHLDEESVRDQTATAAQRGRAAEGVFLSDWPHTGRLLPTDPFLTQHLSTFEPNELRSTKQRKPPDPLALDSFNRLSYPCRELRSRFAAVIPPTPALIDVATRVVALAANSPDDYRSRRRGHAVAAAICLAAPAGDQAFTAALLKLLAHPLDDVQRLLGDDVTELCDAALAVSSRENPWALKSLIENEEADDHVRSVALGALSLHLDLGSLTRESVADYCRQLMGRDPSFGVTFFWSDLADLSAKAGAIDLMPAFKSMFREGGGWETYRDEEDVAAEFTKPYERVAAWKVIDTFALFDSSDLSDDHRGAREFIQCFEVPRPYPLLEDDSPEEGEETE